MTALEPDDEDDSDDLRDFLNALWSRYCPSCSERHPLTDSVCRKDGSELRDLSISVPWTDLPWTTYISDLTGGCSSENTDSAPKEPPSEHSPGMREDLPEVLGNRWRVVREHGKGGFGKFFIGSHAILGMEVGIKLLRNRFLRTEAGRRLFHEEAMRLSLLRHPGIVKVFDYGEDAGRPYLVMEFLSGKPLHREMAEGTLTLDEVVKIVRQTAVALMAAHSGAGIGEPLVHLDLKPEHIFVERIRGDWHVKVIDFGIAEMVRRSGNGTSNPDAPQAESAPSKKRVIGTLPYMAPERWDGVADPRCDIYSLGIILYELVAGEKPFKARDKDEMERLHRKYIPPPPSRVLHGGMATPERGLDRIILHCLEKDPAKRPQTAEALVEALEKWLATRPPLSLLQRVLRNLAAPALVTLAALALFYWAPWEKIGLPPEFRYAAQPPVLGPGRPLDVSFTPPGPGYRDGTAEMYLTRDGTTYEVKLGSVGDSVSITPAQLNGSGAVEDGEYSARLVVHGWLGRSVASDAFKVLLDTRPPAILHVDGMKKDKIGTLWLLGKELRVSADEDLDPGECSLKGPGFSITAVKAEEARSVKFTVPQDASELHLRLRDRAGNSVIRDWSCVRRFESPSLFLQEPFKTNESNYPLELTISGSCARVKINDYEVEDLTHGELTFCKKAIELFAKQGGKQKKSVHIQVWSELSNREDGPPEVDRRIEVEYWKRELRIDVVTSGGPMPERFEVRCNNEGVEETVADVRWECKASLEVGHGSKPLVVHARVLEDGKLDKTTNQRGWLNLWVTATDGYGNTCTNILKVPHQIQDPDIQFGLADETGTETRPLLNKADYESLLDKLPAGASLTFTCISEYQEPSALAYEIRVGSLDNEDHALKVSALGGKVRVPLAKLLDLLVPGPNEVFLIATDERFKQISGRASCDLHYAEPLSIKVEPPEGRVSEDHVNLTVHAEGPSIEKVVINDVRQPPDPSMHGAYRRFIPLRPFGETRVTVSITLAGGYKREMNLSYIAAPAGGGRYTFDVGGELGSLWLEYVDPRSSEKPYWRVPADVSREVLERFRASEAGKRFKKSHSARLAPDTPNDHCFASEAAEVKKWVTDVCRLRNWLPQGAEADLPTLNQAKALVTSPDQRVWLSGNDNDARIVKFEASYAELSPDGALEPKGASDSTERAALRLVLPHGVGRLSPEHAAGWTPNKKRQ